MGTDTTRTVTVDRISNNGNPIARETHNGKTIHVPSGLTGKTYDVRLDDRGSYVVARLVHEQSGARTQQPTSPPAPSASSQGLLELGKDLIGDETITMEQRECSDNRLDAGEYPGQSHRSEIASRHD